MTYLSIQINCSESERDEIFYKKIFIKNKFRKILYM